MKVELWPSGLRHRTQVQWLWVRNHARTSVLRWPLNANFHRLSRSRCYFVVLRCRWFHTKAASACPLVGNNWQGISLEIYRSRHIKCVLNQIKNDTNQNEVKTPPTKVLSKQHYTYNMGIASTTLYFLLAFNFKSRVVIVRYWQFPNSIKTPL